MATVMLADLLLWSCYCSITGLVASIIFESYFDSQSAMGYFAMVVFLYFHKLVDWAGSWCSLLTHFFTHSDYNSTTTVWKVTYLAAEVVADDDGIDVAAE